VWAIKTKCKEDFTTVRVAYFEIKAIVVFHRFPMCDFEIALINFVD
jgi:hypothetical protein